MMQKTKISEIANQHKGTRRIVTIGMIFKFCSRTLTLNVISTY